MAEQAARAFAALVSFVAAPVWPPRCDLDLTTSEALVRLETELFDRLIWPHVRKNQAAGRKCRGT